MKVFMKLRRARGARPTGVLFVLSAVLIASAFGATAPKGKNLTEAERAARRKTLIAPVAEGVLRARPTFAMPGLPSPMAKADSCASACATTSPVRIMPNRPFRTVIPIMIRNTNFAQA